MKGFADVCAVIHYLYFLPLTICSINASKDHNNSTTAQLCAKPLLTVQFFHQQGVNFQMKTFSRWIICKNSDKWIQYLILLGCWLSFLWSSQLKPWSIFLGSCYLVLSKLDQIKKYIIHLVTHCFAYGSFHLCLESVQFAYDSYVNTELFKSPC